MLKGSGRMPRFWVAATASSARTAVRLRVGELFVIRVAGNVLSPEIAGSLQYAGTHLKTQLFMVLGHESCGAVAAALAAKFEGVQQRLRIQLLLESMLAGLDDAGPAASA